MGPKRVKKGPKMGQKSVIFGVTLYHFWVDPGSLWGHSGTILVSFWHHFGVILTQFEVFFGPLWNIFGRFVPFWGFGSKEKCIETVKPYFEEDAYGYRSVKQRGQTGTNSSMCGPFLVPQRPFYIGIENVFRSYLFLNRLFTKINLYVNCICLVVP